MLRGLDHSALGLPPGRGGRPRRRRPSKPGELDLAIRSQNRSFDAAGRFATQSGLGFSSAGSYSYDPNSGRKTAEDLPLALGGTIAGTFSYFAGGRLATATTNGAPESFSFDEAGNLVLDAISDVGETSFIYDAANRLTSSASTPALDGASTATTYYGWDAANAWRTCQGPDASATQANEPIDFTYNAHGRMSSYANADAGASASYTYDASGQRTKSVVAVGGTTTTTSFAYDALTLLKLSATQGGATWRIDYLTDEEGAPYGGVYRSPSSSTAPTYFTLVTSDRGDVVALCDADGVAFAAYRYDAWGSPQGSGTYATGIWTQGTALVNATLAGQIASRQILRYASYAYDAESGLYYCSARYYDPATRQWTTGDPAKADGEESAYQYCGGEPICHVDRTGRNASNFLWALYQTVTYSFRLQWGYLNPLWGKDFARQSYTLNWVVDKAIYRWYGIVRKYPPRVNYRALNAWRYWQLSVLGYYAWGDAYGLYWQVTTRNNARARYMQYCLRYRQSWGYYLNYWYYKYQAWK